MKTGSNCYVHLYVFKYVTSNAINTSLLQALQQLGYLMGTLHELLPNKNGLLQYNLSKNERPCEVNYIL